MLINSIWIKVIGINIFIHDKPVYNAHTVCFNMTGFGNKLSLY